MTTVERPGPLDGIRVLDFCHFLAGPYAALVLADLGADVIKVEDPDHPDEARSLGPCFRDGQSLYFASLNWAKRSFAARLGSREGHAAVIDLVRTADVVIDNFRPGVMAKLRLDHETLTEVNQRLVTCSVTGFGETGPYSARPGYDYTIQALAGVMSLTGEPDGPPGKAGISYVDHSGGLAAGLAVCSALVERERTGVGRHIDLALFDVQISMLTYLAAWELNAGFTPQRYPNGSHPSLVPAQIFATADGYISIFVGNDPMWGRLVAALEDPRVADQRFSTAADRSAQREALLPLLSEILERETSAAWISLLSAHSVPCAPVNTVSGALDDPHTRARGLVGTAEHPGYAAYDHAGGPIPMLSTSVTKGAPLAGQDTEALLQEIGYSAGRISSLVDSGAVAVQDRVPEHR